jgi:hypothetical protein
MLPHLLPQQIAIANIRSLIEMAKDPWKDPDPGDFDAELDRAQVDIQEGIPDAKPSILVRVEGDDAKRVERIADERGQPPGEVVSPNSCAAPMGRRERQNVIHGL